MPSRTTRQPPSRPTLRHVGFVIAVALGVVGIWLVATAKSTQRVEIGVLTGLWGLLLGALCGRRGVLPDAGSTPADPPPADSAPADSAQVAVRDSATVDRLADAEARRAFEAELQRILRQELGTAVHAAVQNAVDREIGALRAEIAQLRQELADKAGGQVRVERIESTRVIGSDLEAMRAEVRRLKMASDPAAFDPPAFDLVAADVDDEVDDDVHDVVDDDVDDVDDEVDDAPVAAPRPVNGVLTTTETTRIPRVLPEEPEPEPHEEPEPDPFASLPRLTPFTDFPLDLLEPAAEASTDSKAGTAENSTVESSTAESRRPGRRHHRDDDQAETSEAEHGSGQVTGRRHRRADDSGDDLLARLLAREGVRR